MRPFPSFLPLAAMTAALSAPVMANDSEAAFGLGGLELVRNEAVSMDSEDLFISKHEVRVDYRFTNRSTKDVELLVSFPLPPIPGPNADQFGAAMVPDFKTLKFTTTVDGKPVKLGMVQRSEIAGRDVTARLAALGLPREWFGGSGEVPGFIEKLTPQQRAAYLKEGLLRRDRNFPDILMPAWDTVTHVTRRQLFPAGKTVAVSHRYEPLIGGSVGGVLYPALRKDYPEHLRKYCVDKDFIATFDKRSVSRRADDPNPLPYGETWISYILSSGRNWRGPIGSFRLVVDKDKPGNLVSFCMTGVRKISPTRFEVRKSQFEPKGDLDILIVEWPDPE